MRYLKWLHSILFGISNKVTDEEKIIRGIYSPMNYDVKKQKLNTNFFRIQGGVDGVSVIRLDYAPLIFCKFHCKKNENVESKRTFYGFSLLFSHEIRSSSNSSYTADVVSSPLRYKTYSFPQHADIIYGYVATPGDPLPIDLKLVIESIYRKACSRIYQDPSPNSILWKGNSMKNL